MLGFKSRLAEEDQMGLYEDHSQTTPHKKTFFRRRFPGHFSGPFLKSGHVVLNSTEETKPVLFFFLCLAFLVLLSLERMTRLSSYEVLVRVYTITRFNHQFFRMSVRLKDSVFWKYFMPVIISCGGSPPHASFCPCPIIVIWPIQASRTGPLMELV